MLLDKAQALYRRNASAWRFSCGDIPRQSSAARQVPRRLDGSIGANPVAVRVIAVAAVCSSANSGRADRCRAYRCRTDTIAAIAAPIAAIATIACASHCDSAAAPRSSNCDRAAAVAAATPIASSGLGIIGDQEGGEQNDSGKRRENIAEHDREPSYELFEPCSRDCGSLPAGG